MAASSAAHMVEKTQSVPALGKLKGADRERAFHRMFLPLAFEVAGTVVPDPARRLTAAYGFLAHWAAETDRGGGLYNWNLGNIHGGGDWAKAGHDEYMSTDTDVGGTGNKYNVTFRAYDTAHEGAYDAAALMMRAPARRTVILTGDILDLYVAMRNTGYFNPWCSKDAEGKAIACTDDQLRQWMVNQTAAIKRDTSDVDYKAGYQEPGVTVLGASVSTLAFMGLFGVGAYFLWKNKG